ncbi:serine/threonine kinase family protein [Plesiocystis pacifica SIR-1]|uniref:Serine/threonine kinase family protein n=1 Tax=Plesiocystis pacifica SIR-1 TaxID=391625 RepID=A6G9K7_9BACT|nr:serine/threonine kinase family protein [Plesiocystis pacifica SIR-1]
MDGFDEPIVTAGDPEAPRLESLEGAVSATTSAVDETLGAEARARTQASRGARPRSLEDTVAPGESGPGRRRPVVYARGGLIDRYVILDKLGAGAMGVVYAAHDPELDRKVALKLVRPSADGVSGESRTRLLREAQALAKLDHPNVVGVHDVGTVGEQVWIAMQFVEGRTLGAWKREARASWAEVLALMLQAGEGLAAAHEAGLLHRDFKPDNVMVGDDGVVRVMDFGLARAHREAPTDASSRAALEAAAVSTSPGLSAELTRAGAMMGTPAYMSREQFAGDPVEATTDQFSFCVTLWELVYGERPFGGGSPFEIANAVATGERRAPPPGVSAPRWLRRACERGLAPEASARHPDMRALLTALERGQARERAKRGRRWALAGLGFAAAIGAGVVGQQRHDHRQRVAGCQAEGESIDAVWNASARAALREGLLATGVPYAPETADKAIPWLDAQAKSWRETATTACTRHVVEGRWGAPTHAKARWCLEESRRELSARIATMRDADAVVVRQAVKAATSMAPPANCIDEDALAAMPPPPPPAQRDEVAAVQAQLSRAAYLRTAAKLDEGHALVEDARARADALAWPPLQIAATYSLAVSHERLANYDEAEQLAVAAYLEAVRTRSWAQAAEAASELAYIVGYNQTRFDEGLLWVEHARAIRTHGGDPLELGAAKTFGDLAAVHYKKADYAAAITNFEAALAIQRRALGADHPHVARDELNLGSTLYSSGEYPEARAKLAESVTMMRAAYGPHHPDTANALNSLGAAHLGLGEYDEAALALEESVDIYEAILGPRHEDVGDGLANLAVVYRNKQDYERARELSMEALDILEEIHGPDDLGLTATLMVLANLDIQEGELARARASYERVLAIQDKALGPEHPETAMALNNLGYLVNAQGDYPGGLAYYERALAIRKASLGAEHPKVAITLGGIGELHQQAGELGRARAAIEEGLTILEASVGPETEHVAKYLVVLADIALAQRELDDAADFAQRCIDIRTNDEAAATALAQPRWVLARALWLQSKGRGDEAERARELATQARDALREAGPEEAETLAAVEAWLSER